MTEGCIYSLWLQQKNDSSWLELYGSNLSQQDSSLVSPSLFLLLLWHRQWVSQRVTTDRSNLLICHRYPTSLKGRLWALPDKAEFFYHSRIPAFWQIISLNDCEVSHLNIKQLVRKGKASTLRWTALCCQINSHDKVTRYVFCLCSRFCTRRSIV